MTYLNKLPIELKNIIYDIKIIHENKIKFNKCLKEILLPINREADHYCPVDYENGIHSYTYAVRANCPCIDCSIAGYHGIAYCHKCHRYINTGDMISLRSDRCNICKDCW